MGSQVAEEQIIDLDMKGLVAPAEVHECGEGGDDDGRPGDFLISQIRDFAAGGGFTELGQQAEAREQAGLEKDEKARVASGKRTLISSDDFAARIGEEVKDDKTADGDRK